MSTSDMESALGELGDIKCVHVIENLPSFTYLTFSHGTTNLNHLAKTVVIPDVAFVT